MDRIDVWGEGETGFYVGRRIFLTGHTGFKGTWLTRILLNAGAVVTGYALDPPTKPNLYSWAGIEGHPHMTSVIGDVRDLEHLKQAFREAEPEIVFHLAAQPIVRDSYKDPVGTYQTNVMGTVNLLECVRLSVPGQGLNLTGDWTGVRSVLNVTTDKVYQNKEWCWGYREDEPLDGYDPYSNSKSCSELATHSYRSSFFADNRVRISTARAGNVIGGGDFANDRIVPDCVRAVMDAEEKGESEATIGIRNPQSTRPYQHVLEPLYAYLMIAAGQYEEDGLAGSYNVGPDDCDCVTTWELAEMFCRLWNESGQGVRISCRDLSEKNAPHEANFLKLDCAKLKSTFGWKPHWHVEKCMEETVRFYEVWKIAMKNGDHEAIAREMDREIMEYMTKEM